MNQLPIFDKAALAKFRNVMDEIAREELGQRVPEISEEQKVRNKATRARFRAWKKSRKQGS